MTFHAMPSKSSVPATVPGLRITIVGGLAAGAFLRRAGLAATVYEQAPIPRTAFA